MSRADQARRQQLADEADRLAHERPNQPPALNQYPNPDAWEGFCAGNRTSSHLAPTKRTPDRWQCGSCGRWLHPPRRTLTCRHEFTPDTGLCCHCGAVNRPAERTRP
jgi:hypothetical protein